MHEGYDSKTPRAVLRTAFSAGILNKQECEIMLRALDSRNLPSHAYSAQVALQAEELIKEHFYPVLGRIFAKLRTGTDDE